MKTAVFLYKENPTLDAGFGVAYSYGVDHSGFSLRDEIEYQTARNQRERQLMQMYNQQGITENYPQYTTNFWDDADNNYGFGTSNINIFCLRYFSYFQNYSIFGQYLRKC